VDGYQGSSGSYTVSVTCSPVADAENCSNGFDDDADGAIDCDDEDCFGTELCGAVCQAVAPINCGDQVFGTTSTTECGDGLDDDGDGLVDCDDPDCASFQGCPGGSDPVGLENPAVYPFHAQTTDVMNGYPCEVPLMDGPEVVYEWVNTGGQRTVEWKLPSNLVHLLPSQGVNHEPIVLDGDNNTCINTQCLDHDGVNVVEFGAAPGHTYYLVVDGPEALKGPYGAELDCDP